jgi:hypothetical protein
VVRHELNALNQRPTGWQKPDGLSSIATMAFIHSGGQLAFPVKQSFRLIPFQFGSSLRAEMATLPRKAT